MWRWLWNVLTAGGKDVAVDPWRSSASSLSQSHQPWKGHLIIEHFHKMLSQLIRVSRRKKLHGALWRRKIANIACCSCNIITIFAQSSMWAIEAEMGWGQSSDQMCACRLSFAVICLPFTFIYRFTSFPHSSSYTPYSHYCPSPLSVVTGMLGQCIANKYSGTWINIISIYI